MRTWFLLIAVLAAAPLMAEDTSPDNAEEGKEPIDPWEDFEVGDKTDGAYLPLTLGRDRTGLGLRTRMSFGWDSNVYKVDRNQDNAFYLDGAAFGYVGVDFGAVALGARGMLAGRLHFGETDADMWDMKLGGFVKLPYGGGGWGFGISGDILYQQLQTYELLGPITRQDDLRAAGAIARAYVGYKWGGFMILELGFTGKTEDFTEERELTSVDNWEIGTDFSIWFNFFDVIAIKPYIKFDYQWFRDQLDTQDDGTPLSTEDKVQLLKFDYGADLDLDFGFIRATARAYSLRQDDSAAGFLRYWQYGIRGAIDFMMVGAVKLSAGGHFWTREYDDRVDLDTGEPMTLFERYFSAWVELSWNFWEFMDLGARYRYSRRISGLNNGGYADHDLSVFLGISF